MTPARNGGQGPTRGSDAAGNLVVDLDGVLYLENEPIPGAGAALSAPIWSIRAPRMIRFPISSGERNSPVCSMRSRFVGRSTFPESTTRFWWASVFSIVSTEIHLIKRFRPGFWLSLDANYYTGGETRIGTEFRDDLQRNSRAGLTLVLPLKGRHALRASISSGIATRSGGAFDIASRFHSEIHEDTAGLHAGDHFLGHD